MSLWHDIYKTYITAAERCSNMNLHCGTSQWQKNNDAKHAQANTQGTHTKDIETDNMKEL